MNSDCHGLELDYRVSLAKNIQEDNQMIVQRQPDDCAEIKMVRVAKRIRVGVRVGFLDVNVTYF